MRRIQSLCWLASFIALCTSQNTCITACDDLRAQLPSGYVTTKNKPSRYWAQQIREIHPACYVQPQLVNEVATVVKVAENRKCQFAVLGGGHSDVPGASNLAGGITLDLNAFTDIKVNPSAGTVSVGPGLDWGTVYQALDPQNLRVIGGRESTVGVAGLTLGGGISYFSPSGGFACDNVKNYQVVLAGGKVVEANATSKYKDLFRALRGGGNNFGVVTRFDLITQPYTLMDGGLNTYSDSAATTKGMVEAFAKFASPVPNDDKAALFTSLDYFGAGVFKWINGYYYATPVLSANVTKFKPYYTKQLVLARSATTERFAKHGNFAQELGLTQPSGMRNQFHTATFKVNTTLMTQMFQIFREESMGIEQTGANMAFQPIQKSMLQRQSLDGVSNVLGVDVSESPLMLLSMAWPWQNAADDAKVTGAMDRVVQRSVNAAKKMGLFNQYIYMNYATPGEPVIASYGADNVAFLKNVSAKYDPAGTFQKLVPGGFKLP